MTTKRTLTILGATSAAAVLSLTACGSDGPTDSPESAAATFATAWNQSDKAKDCVTMMTGSESDQHTASDMTDCLGDFKPDDSLEVFETEDIGDGKGVVIGHAGTEAFAVYVIEADDGWTPREYVMLTDGERAAGEGIPRLEGEVQSS